MPPDEALDDLPRPADRHHARRDAAAARVRRARVDPRLRDALRLVLGDPDPASIGALRAELAGHGVMLAPDELARAPAAAARSLTS